MPLRHQERFLGLILMHIFKSRVPNSTIASAWEAQTSETAVRSFKSTEKQAPRERRRRYLFLSVLVSLHASLEGEMPRGEVHANLGRGQGPRLSAARRSVPADAGAERPLTRPGSPLGRKQEA